MKSCNVDYTGLTVQALLCDPMMDKLFESDRTDSERALRIWTDAMRSRSSERQSALENVG